MNIGAVAVSPNKVVRDAEENYRGGFFCCEALMGAVCDNFDLDVADDVVAMSSAMAVGIDRKSVV